MKPILSVDLNSRRGSKGGASAGDDEVWRLVSGKPSVSEDKKVMELRGQGEAQVVCVALGYLPRQQKTRCLAVGSVFNE